jgi:hypothetical protein
MDIERLAGTKLGNYEIESLLGRGGMNLMYKVYQRFLDHPVAARILLASCRLESPSTKCLQGKPRTATKLNHAKNVRISGVFIEKAHHFLRLAGQIRRIRKWTNSNGIVHSGDSGNDGSMCHNGAQGRKRVNTRSCPCKAKADEHSILEL